MIEKYQTSGPLDRDFCFMKYDYVMEVLIVGGHGDCIDFIDNIVENYVSEIIPENIHKQRARVRYKFKMTKAKYRELKAQLLEAYDEGFQKIDKLDRRL